jgi:hypothetical protein
MDLDAFCGRRSPAGSSTCDRPQPRRAERRLRPTNPLVGTHGWSCTRLAGVGRAGRMGVVGGPNRRFPGACARSGAASPRPGAARVRCFLIVWFTSFVLSALDDADGDEPRHAAGQPGALDGLDDGVDVLVRERGLLGESPVGPGSYLDPGCRELAA